MSRQSLTQTDKDELEPSTGTSDNHLINRQDEGNASTVNTTRTEVHSSLVQQLSVTPPSIAFESSQVQAGISEQNANSARIGAGERQENQHAVSSKEQAAALPVDTRDHSRNSDEIAHLSISSAAVHAPNDRQNLANSNISAPIVLADCVASGSPTSAATQGDRATMPAMSHPSTEPSDRVLQEGKKTKIAVAFVAIPFPDTPSERDIEQLVDDARSEMHRDSTGMSISTTDQLSIHDIIIPARLLSVASWNARRSMDSVPRNRRSTVLSKTSREDFDIQRIAREQSLIAQQALKRSIDDVNPPTLLQEAHFGGGSRTISFALPPPSTHRFGGSGTSNMARTSFKQKTSAMAHEPTDPRPSPVGPFWLSNGTGTEKSDSQIHASPTYPSPRRPTQIAWANTNPFAATSDSLDVEVSNVVHSRDIFARNSQLAVQEHAEKGHSSEPRKRSTLRTSTAPPRPSNADSMFAVARRGTVARVGSVLQSAAQGVTDVARRMSLFNLYEKAKVRGVELQRSRRFQLVFEWSIYLLLLAFVYLVLVGMPIWKGAVYWLYIVVKFKFVIAGTWSITIGIAAIYAFAPLCILFEKDPPMPEEGPVDLEAAKATGVHDTALLIPCYKSANIIGPTLVAALKIFPANQIFVISNGNSPTPLDNTEEVCTKYGASFIWSPVGSKIVAQFVGCFAAKKYKNVLLIDDDCALPPNFPIVSDRMKGKIQCIGYTIKSVGPDSSKGTYCQQAQDLEYKLSGLQRGFAGMVGSATFPHGAISIWNTEFLISTFYQHPGYSVSEDWFFGHAARQLGCRITMCTSVFVETETPSSIFFSSGGSRGGFGEMTVFKQRFMRWNFFFVTGIAYNMDYIFRSWKLGWWEIGAKLFVFQEVYETLLYLLAPFILPISLAIRPAFTGYLFAGVFGLYFVNTIIFNEIHLRLKNERIGWKTAYPYYTFYKMVLLGVNIASCYWSIWKYATYFAKRHPMIIEDEKAIDVVLRLEEQKTEPSEAGPKGRRMTVAAIGSQMRDYSITGGQDGRTPAHKMTLMTFGPSLSHAVNLGNRERRGTTAVLVEDRPMHDSLEPIKWENPFAQAEKPGTMTTSDGSDDDGPMEACPNSPGAGYPSITLGSEAGPDGIRS
ncbi:hypothetical protein QFC21_007258 [Naganishia friedmannii]|uniref:Uncharacterized protein n=1 Tax=Naganishia friedmannii TaxID=89922 RepID=A0ACC2UWS8_9TREE|nr:hypothetical protein QFC21_007258 [Naganishia friedmannii]